MEFETLIGLELHLQLNTKSKLFSSSKNSFGDAPNTNVFPLDIALPGSQPTLNIKIVEQAIMMASALNMEIDNVLVFDRKNYFYSDLAKGYQITQNKRPIGKKGILEIGERTFKIQRLHIEEDTAKQIHDGNNTFIDYNRSGVPLLEIVFEPDIHDGKSAVECVKEINRIASFLNISEGRLENGTLRCDVNVSIREKGSQTLNNKVEIKNLNSYKNILESIALETNRQISLFEKGFDVDPQTFAYNENSKELVPLRDKTSYRFLPESNIPPVELYNEFILGSIDKMNLIPNDYRLMLKEMGLEDDDIERLICSYKFVDYFMRAARDCSNVKLLTNWMLTNIKNEFDKNEDIVISPFNMATLINLIDKNEISNHQAKEIFVKMIESNDSPIDIKNKLNIKRINDEDSIRKLIKQILSVHVNAISEYNNGNDHILKFLMGQIMKETNGQIDPSLTNRLLKEEMEK